MPRDINGNFSLDPTNPVAPGTVIETGWANPTLTDIAAALTDSLSRSGAGGMLAPFRFADGTLAAPGIAFTNEPSSGLYRAALNDIRFAIGSSDVLRFIPSGVTIPGGKSLTVSGPITGGSINGTPIGGTTPSTGAFTSVTTPLVTSPGLLTLGAVGDVLLSPSNGSGWMAKASSQHLVPNGNNDRDFGIAGTNQIRTGYFGTSVVTPQVTTASGNLEIKESTNTSRWILVASDGSFQPNAGDNTQNIGAPAGRIKTVFTPIIDSGTAGAVTIKVNNGEQVASFNKIGTIANGFAFFGTATGSPPIFRASGSDANLDLDIRSQGTGAIDFRTDGGATAVLQAQILHTAGSTRWPTFTGSNGGNPTIGATGGSIAFSAPILPLAGIPPAFESAQFTWPINGGVISVAHGLGRVPKNFRMVARFTAADSGYAIGDEVDVQSSSARATPTVLSFSSTNDDFALPVAGGGLTPPQFRAVTASIKLVFYAW